MVNVKNKKGVARLARAWIETDKDCGGRIRWVVARLARAWIETQYRNHSRLNMPVARLARAWIETEDNYNLIVKYLGRPPRAGVD